MFSKRALRLLSACICCALIVSCGGAPCAPCSVAYGSAPAPSDAIPIEWLSIPRGGRLPLVAAYGQGLRARLVLDTGSNMHLWGRGALWVLSAHSTDGQDERGVDALDPEERAVPMERFDPLPLSVGLRGLPDRIEALGRPLGVLEELGLAGLLSPQHLARRLPPSQGGLRIDLVRSRVSVISAAELERALREGTPLEAMCRSPEGTPLFGVSVQAEGRTRRVIVDTGSDAVVLHDPGGTWARARSRETDWFWALGGASERPVIETDLRFAGVSRRVRLSLIPTAHCAEGQLGIDALEGCSLSVGRDRAALECR